MIETKLFPVINSIGKGIFKVRCGNDKNNSIMIIGEATAVEYCYLVGGEMPTVADIEHMVTA